jgi:hypothetical protein
VKNFSAGLLSFLANNTAYGRADLFAITCGKPQNMLSYSQDFEQSTVWVGSSSGASNPVVTPDSQTDPNGGSTADTIAFPATGAGQYSGLAQVLAGALPTINYTFSIWLKAASAQTILLILEAQPFTLGSNSISVSVTTSWQRFSVTFSLPATNSGIDVQLRNVASSAAQTIYCWGAQLEGASSMGVYVPTQATPLGPLGPRATTINATSWQVDLSYQGVTFYASQNGAWERGKITSEASFDLRANDMSLIVASPSTVLYAATGVSLMAAAQLGLFDAAFIAVYTAYFPLNLTPSATNAFIASVGVENKYAGYIKPAGSISRSKIEFEVADPLYVLNLKMPRNLIQSGCRHTFCDANCTLSAASFTASNTVASGSTRQLINLVTALGSAPPRYSQGSIKMTSGFNSGLQFSIKQQISTTQILLAIAMPLPLAIGDTFTVITGCDKTPATCQNVYGNLIHIGAFPFVPNPETAI